MNVVLSAIYDRAVGNVNDFATSIGNRFYFSRAPQNTVFPYCVYYLVTENYDYTFTEDMEEIVVQFSIFSEESSTSEIGTIYGYLRDRFDWCTLAIGGYTFLKMEREFAHRTWLPDEEVWSYVVQYRILIEK